MSSTIGDLVDRIYREYLEPADAVESYSYLTGSISSTGQTTFNYEEDLFSSEEEDALEQDASGVKITGTDFGQDKDTQITTFVTGQQLTFIRNVSSTSRLDLDTSNSYTIVLIQNGVTNTIKVNGGSDSIIQITQSL